MCWPDCVIKSLLKYRSGLSPMYHINGLLRWLSRDKGAGIEPRSNTYFTPSYVRYKRCM